MPEHSRINLPPTPGFVETAPGSSSTSPTSPSAAGATQATGNAPAQPPSTAPSHQLEGPQPAVPHGVLDRLKSTMARKMDTLRARRFDVGTAIYQQSTHGKTSGPENYVQGTKRYATTQPPRHARVGGSMLASTDGLVTGAIGRTVSKPAASANAQTSGAPAQLRVPAPPPLDACTTRERLLDYVHGQFACPPDRLLDVPGLASRLYALTPQADPPTPASAAEAATRGALMAQALRQAGVTDIDGAHLALERVGMLDFNAPHTARSTSAADRQAWLVARTLARSGEGFAALDALRSAVGQPFAGDPQRTATRVLLQATDALDPHAPGTSYPRHSDPSPAAVAESVGLAEGTGPLDASVPGPDALAKRAFDAAATHLEHGRDALTPDQKGAFFAWRQGFTADGRGSDLSQARERLNKFSAKTIHRVGENRWKTLLPRMFAAKRASPLSALTFGTQGLPRKTVEQERAALARGMGAARTALAQHDAMQPATAFTHARPAQSLVELAALDVWLERGGFARGRMDEDALGAVAQRAAQMCDGLTEADVPSAETLASVKADVARWQSMPPDQLAKTKPFSKIAKQRFDIERLAVWGKVAHVDSESDFWNEVDTLRTLADPAQDKRPANTVDDVHDTLKDVVANLQSGAKLRLTDGGRQGVSTRGLNATVHAFTHGHGIPVSPRIDVRASRTREAVVEVSRATHGVEMFVGTAHSRQQHYGAGVLVGYDFDVGVTSLRAGVVASAILHSQDLQEPRGVSLRVARRVKPDGSGYDDDAMRAKLGTIVDHVFHEATLEHNDGSNGVWNRLAQQYFDDPDVSVSWTDGQQKTTRRGVTVDATAMFKAASLGADTETDPVTGKHAKQLSVSVGPTLGAGWEHSKQSVDSVERTGRMQVEQHRVGLGSRWQLRGGFKPSFSHPLDPNSHSSIGMFSLDAPMGTMTLGDKNRSAKLQLVREDGKLNHRACMLDVEYLDAKHYTEALDAGRPELIGLFAAQEVAQRNKAGTASSSGPLDDPRVVAGKRIDQHLADVRKNQRPNLTYMHRFRLRESAALRIDANTAALAQSGGDARLRAQVEARNAEILGDPDSWMPIELKVKERSTDTRSVGLNVLAQLHTRTSATGDREIVTENVSFDVLEALDRRQPPQLGA
ncbi:Autotransporter [Paraburkholderia kururiensis]|uniref:autotransporter n=1 Tax=Paraburkholderia kururiensis TaxID=984307 RepID=UPI0039A66077